MLVGLNRAIRFRRIYWRYLWMGLIAGGWLGCSGSESTEGQAARSESPVEVMPAFTDVTVEAGLGDFRHDMGAYGQKLFPESMGSGGGFIDYDGDGWIDILLVGGGTFRGSGQEWPVPALWLYRNNGDGTFSLKTEEAGLGNLTTYGFGIAVADYDNDGDQDFYLTSLYENMLFRNDGGVFTEVGEAAGVTGGMFWSTSAIFFDADKDSWVDLYMANYVEWSLETDLWCTLDGVTRSYCTPEIYPGLSGRFYHNNGDGTFTDQTESAGFHPVPGKSLGIAELDFNRDGWPDLMVTNDTQPNLLFVNNGDGTFEEKGALSGIAYDENGRARAGMGVDAGIVDNSGEVTVFVANFSKEMIGVFRHAGNGLFIDRAAASKIGRPSLMRLTFALFLFDFDLDGDLDLFAANGHVQMEIDHTQDGITYRETPYLFINNGNGIFEEVSETIGGVFTEPIVARSATYADFDRDGDVDIMITESNGPVHLWRKEQTPGVNFLRVRLEGHESNRDGLGARVIAIVGGQRMERRIRNCMSIFSTSEKTATFGLAEATSVDSLVVYWPSGRVERFAEIVQVNREIQLVEGSGTMLASPLPGKKVVDDPDA